LGSWEVGSAWSVQHQPTFEDFDVPAENITSPAPPKITSGKPHRYRTILRRESAKGANFAGRYRIAQWGCGTCCAEFAIINEQTGAVYFPWFAVVCKTPFESEYGGQAGIDFKETSRLLVITGTRNERNPGGRYFYEWTGKRLRLLLSLEPE